MYDGVPHIQIKNNSGQEPRQDYDDKELLQEHGDKEALNNYNDEPQQDYDSDTGVETDTNTASSCGSQHVTNHDNPRRPPNSGSPERIDNHHGQRPYQGGRFGTLEGGFGGSRGIHGGSPRGGPGGGQRNRRIQSVPFNTTNGHGVGPLDKRYSEPDTKQWLNVPLGASGSNSSIGTASSRKGSIFEDLQDQHVPRDCINDLTDLEILDQQSILSELEKRYSKNIVYTYIGDVTIAINPFCKQSIYTEEYYKKYTKVDLRSDLPPHIFWVGAQAYQRLRENGTSQSILINGESGAGKTESAKYIINYIANLCASREDNLHEKVVEVNPLLEAFGNAQTVMNDNSSRFGKLVELHFVKDGSLSGAEIFDYMLEKSRVVQQAEFEKNFHIFYYLFAGLPDDVRREYALQAPEKYRILHGDTGPGLGSIFASSDDRDHNAKQFKEVYRIMQHIGFEKLEISLIYSVLSAILNLTNITFVQTDGHEEELEIEDDEPLEGAATMLNVPPSLLRSALVKEEIFITKAGIREMEEKNKSMFEAEGGRDALAKTLYARTFGWLVKQINKHLKQEIAKRPGNTILILDMSGFENVQKNSFEQLCINVANEKMQYHFNEHIFSQEQLEYEQDGIDWSKIQYENNIPLLDLFLGGRNGKEKIHGILDLLDDCSRLTTMSSDKAFVEKVNTHFQSHTHYGAQTDPLHFAIHHYPGTVIYSANGFLEKNRDRLGLSIEECMRKSKNKFIKELFALPYSATGSLSRKKKEMLDSVQRRNAQATVVKHFKNSLLELMNKISQTDPLFVRCIKPNENRAPNKFDAKLVQTQLVYNGLLEIAKIRRYGYPVRMGYDSFLNKYKIISFKLTDSHENNVKWACRKILRDCKILDAGTGNKKVFLKEWHRQRLRHLLLEHEKKATFLQSCWKGQLTRKRYKKLLAQKKEEEAEKAEAASATPGLSSVGKYPSHPNEQKRLDPSGGVGGGGGGGGALEDVKEVDATGKLNQHTWDIFRDISRETKSTTEQFSGILQCVKAFMYLLMFAIVLCGTVSSKVALLSMTSLLSTLNIAIQKDENVSKEYVRERNNVITALMLVICVPYALTFLTHILKAMFGSRAWPSLPTLLKILVLEGFHSFGLCFLMFRVLPKMDTLRGLAMLNATGTIPALCKFFLGKPLKVIQQTGLSAQGKDNKKKKTASYTICRGSSAAWYIASFLALVVQASACVVVILGGFEIQPNLGMTKLNASNLVRTIATHAVSGKNTTRLLFRESPKTSVTEYFSLPFEVVIGLVFASLNWWQNFVDKDLNINFGCTKFTIPFHSFKVELHELQQKSAIFTSIWKTGITISFMYAFCQPFTLDLSLFNTNTEGIDLWYTVLIQICSGIIVFYFGSLACKLCMQTFSFTLPLTLATPVTVGVIIVQCYFNIIPFNSTWICPEGTSPDRDKGLNYTSAWTGACLLAWWLSQLLVCGYLWFPRQNMMDMNQKLFVLPLYCGTLLEQSLMMNRRRHDKEVVWSSQGYCDYVGTSEADSSSKPGTEEGPQKDTGYHEEVIPKIFTCATMWHETKNEMTQLLKSLFRMDVDQSARRNAKMFFGLEDPDYYEFEAHIFFDDCMELDDDEEYIPNDFVKKLVGVIDEAASAVYEDNLKLDPPEKTPTPYGGRLTWTMLGGTQMVVHLKDKNKIRHKKRWSQVMYMYYLLGYRLAAKRVNYKHKGGRNDGNPSNAFTSHIFNLMPEQIGRKAENTFVLALDGDVDFKPDAVRLLVDRMKKNIKVGAACGRIHPIGSGPLVWYQNFEYAIGHWMQKAAEHVYGCVLCSPGCFSLFRGSALMDDNVMRTYTHLAEEARQYVQYDQGEDRWLCTLLLQQGHRVEYCAASDALTYAPEEFAEFYTQRRRWGPSTMANVMDLLGSFRSTVAKNDNISYPFMLYQGMLFGSTLLAPATVLMMIAGAFNAVLRTNLLHSYLLSMAPAVFYSIVCLVCKGATQITVAAVMSAAYAIIMMIVIVGTIINACLESVLSPNVLFLVGLISFYLICAFLHPQEFLSIAPGFLYFLCIPSGFLLLTIYMFCNMHVVSWGTREVAKKKTAEELEKEEEEKRKAEEEAKTKKISKFGPKSLLKWLGITNIINDLKEFFKQTLGALWGSRASEEKKTQMMLAELLAKMETGTLSKQSPATETQSNTGGTSQAHKLEHAISIASTVPTDQQLETVPNVDLEELFDTDDVTPPHTIIHVGGGKLSRDVRRTMRKRQLPKTPRDDLVNPKWMEDKALGDGPIGQCGKHEMEFWRQLIKTYLEPLTKDKEKEKKVAAELKSMRNTVMFGISMLNILWIIIIYQLQSLKDEVKSAYIPLYINGQKLSYEPTGFVFLSFFAILISLQFLAMLVHRWGTLLHLVARAELRFSGNLNPETDLQDAIQFSKQLQQVSTIPTLDEQDEDPYLALTEISDQTADQDNLDDNEDTSSLRQRKPKRRRDRDSHDRRRPRKHDHKLGIREAHGMNLEDNFRKRLDALRRQTSEKNYGYHDMERHGVVRPPPPGYIRRSPEQNRMMYRTIRDHFNMQQRPPLHKRSRYPQPRQHPAYY